MYSASYQIASFQMLMDIGTVNCEGIVLEHSLILVLVIFLDL